ncbi:MAG TPA: amino acid adenylation domain-containing protein [Verrucomicrobiae bacterium]|nr:amino acid adenylation domain-containing protein [Verrucomicrobiae bacterium]
MNYTDAASRQKLRKRLLLNTRLAGHGSDKNETRVRSRAASDRFPLSFPQQRIWFLDQLGMGSQYNDPFHLRLEGALDAGALRSALDEIVRRHESLRARFEAVDGVLSQRIAPLSELELPIIDISEMSQSQREKRVTELALEEGREAFDLGRGPLLRGKLLRLSPTSHVLLLTFQHIAMDGWSRTVLLNELTVLYEAFARGQASPLPKLALQYADFAAWQRREAQGDTWRDDLAYWKEQLRSIPSLMEWPADFARPAKQSPRGARHELRIERGLTEKLAALSREEGCTLFMTLLAAFQTLAFRHTGQEDVVIGCPIANRNRSEFEGLIGCFLNTLILRANFAGEPSFREALRRVRESAMAAYAHQDAAYERVVEELNPPRDPSYHPVFQTMFIFQNTPMPPREIEGVRLIPFEVHNGTAKFDLTLNLSETRDGLDGWIEYATDLFKPESMATLAGHFQRILEEIVRDPAQSVSRVPMLTQSELRQFAGWNQTRRELPSGVCVHNLFEQQAAKTPDAVAVEFETRRLSYRELEQHAERVACQLRALGVGPEVLVGIYLERSLEMLVAVLAVLKAGGAFVPLDPLLPAERIGFVLEDSRATVLITQPSLEKAVADLARLNQHGDFTRNVQPGVTGKLVLMGLSAAAQPPEFLERTGSCVQPDSLAYVIYTSGSTGRPKGVQIPHRAVVNALEAFRSDLGITDADVLLAVTTLSFDIAMLELLLPLTVGGRVVIASSEAVIDGRRLATEMERSNVTVMQATPTTWRMLLSGGWVGRRSMKILCGGEAWTPELARPLLARCSSLWNMYGPTETTIWSAIQQIENGNEVLIGRPIANTRFHLLDSHGQQVPVGATGELFIGGEGLARGYWRRPELTAQKFVPDHLSAEPGERLYRTGDLARFREDGRIEFLGRADHQVKIRGHRIEISEVEAVLEEHEDVRECVVTAQVDASGENRLTAYLVYPTYKIDARQWRRYLADRLPDYMIPAFFIRLPELPRTPNGKIDRKELPKPRLADTTGRLVAPLPMTEVETLLASIWREVLGVESIGLADNFFELGGHSLMITQAIARIRRAFDVDISIHDFFKAPTVAGIAASIENLRSSCGTRI